MKKQEQHPILDMMYFMLHGTHEQRIKFINEFEGKFKIHNQSAYALGKKFKESSK